MAKGERCHLSLPERETVCKAVYEGHLGRRPEATASSIYRKLCRGVRVGL
jgi:hypothetical protein